MSNFMGKGIQKIGVETVVQSLNTFTRDMNTYTKQLDNATKATTDYSKATEKTGGSGGSFLASIKGMINPLTIATSATIGLATAIFNLGLRGANVIGIGTAFENIVAPILDAGVTAQDFLANLRVAAGDTISELELMRLTNLALAGSTGEMREQFAEALPKLLEVARVQAAATGQSVDYLFQSLITGIKRSSPLLIDNTGLVLKVGAANEAYAASLGITVEQMTTEQKSIALLNATLEAGNLAIEAAGGIQETAATKWARTQALLQNVTDTLAVVFEPTLARVLDTINNVLSSVESGVAVIAPIIEEVMSRVASGIGMVVQFIAPAVQVIIAGITEFVNFLGLATVAAIKGAAAIAAAIGNGLMAGANAFIFPAVIQIATFIADFLSGFSPPKKGPLSTIDKGAGRVMEAWMQGFVGGFSVTPIQEVTNEVNAALGNIGKLSAKQVEDRLAKLDLALRPFQERVKLLEDSFNALKEFTDAGLSAIDAEVNRLLPALAAGDEQAAERIRQLNEQREQIEGITFAREQQMNQAKIDLVLARARQQQERTLLEIQQGRVGAYKELTAAQHAADKPTTASAGKPPPKPTGAGATPSVATSSLDMSPVKPGMVDKPVNPLAGLDAFATEIGDDFLSGLNAGGELETFTANMGELDAQFARIGASDPVQGILGAFEGFGAGIQELVQDAVGWFTDPSKDGLAGFINRVNTEGAGAVFGDPIAAIQAWIANTFQAPFAVGIDLALSVFRNPGDPNSLASYFINFQDSIAESWGEVSEILTLWIAENITLPFVTAVETLTGGTDVEGSIASFFWTLPFRILTAVGDTGVLVTQIFSGLQLWAMGQTEDGGLPGLIGRLIAPFSLIPTGIWMALKNIGAIAWSVMVVPFIEAVNEIIERINAFFQAVNSGGLATFAREVLNLQIPEITFQSISTAPPNWLNPAPLPVNSAGVSSGGSIGGAAKGGLFTGGAINVGERGHETMMSAEPFAVFSNQFVKAMETFSNAVMGGGFAQGFSVPSQAGVGTQNVDNSININANTQSGFNSAEMANRISMARVFGR